MNIEELHKIYLSCSSVTTDSRNCPRGSMFFALKGESFNGNLYANDAIKGGAGYAVADDTSINYSSDRVIIVDDVLTTLQNLAAYHRDYLSIPILAITGTNGKTTTKELTREVLKQKFNVKATEGNYNNHIGVPLTLLSFNEETEFGIVEMGANHPGEIEFLCNIAKPDFGLITNIGKAHLEGFGSIKGVMKTKGELYSHLAENAGTIFANKDNHFLMEMLPEDADTVFYGIENTDGLVHGEASGNGFFLNLKWKNTLTGEEHETGTKLIGSYNLENALAAVTAGCYFDVDAGRINKAISEYTPSNNRSQYIKTENNEVLLDAYNANPSSMQKALDNFKAISGTNKVMILGGMKELGKDSDKEHIDLLNKIKTINVEKVFLIGPEFGTLKNLMSGAVFFNDVDELTHYLNGHPLENKKILVKGSRSNKLEKVIKYL